jgi:uncharacterized protein (TIGR00725 family)
VRRLIVGVMGSGAQRHDALASPLGCWLAAQGVHLLTGGGGGVMEAVAEAFASVRDRRGLVIGVLKGSPAPDGRVVVATPNPWIDLPIRTHLPLSGDQGTEQGSRNHINVLTSDVVVALPGGAGTRSEVALAWRYERPVVAFLGGPALPADWPPVPLATTLDEVAALVLPALAAARRASSRDRGTW